MTVEFSENQSYFFKDLIFNSTIFIFILELSEPYWKCHIFANVSVLSIIFYLFVVFVKILDKITNHKHQNSIKLLDLEYRRAECNKREFIVIHVIKIAIINNSKSNYNLNTLNVIYCNYLNTPNTDTIPFINSTSGGLCWWKLSVSACAVPKYPTRQHMTDFVQFATAMEAVQRWPSRQFLHSFSAAK